MKYAFIKYCNLKKILNNKYIFVCYNFYKISFSLINLIKKKFNLKIIFLNKKISNYFNIFNKKNIYLIFVKNYDYLIDIIKYIYLILNIEPFCLFNNKIFINKIPYNEILKLSKENLIFEIINFLKFKLIKLLNILKNYGKRIDK